jgi:hypothetical protein
MRHIGVYDPTVRPRVPGGLPPSQVSTMLKSGWKKEKTKVDKSNVVIVLKEDSAPGGIALFLVDVPKGTEYLYHSEKDIATAGP